MALCCLRSERFGHFLALHGKQGVDGVRVRHDLLYVGKLKPTDVTRLVLLAVQHNCREKQYITEFILT